MINQTGTRNESRGKQIHEPELYRCPKHPVNGVSGDLPLVFAGWLVFYIPPLMIALALDGYYQWKMKRFVFGDVTIQLYRLWFRSLSIIGVLIIAYLVIPNLNLFYGLTQYFPPLALALLAIAINRLLAHYQKLM
ncbi:hypothetical protein [Pseudomonas sp. A2]|uniref:hypothetical protein n=1 Tax=Pseudomonas sp. A2 TaxID=107445 RepID=UPI001FFEBB8B|nr:hypothetical protein [Pseudomonas sp. A2]